MNESDFGLEGSGNDTVFLLVPKTRRAKKWIDQHIGEDNGYQPYYPEKVVVEHRFISGIVYGIKQDGLTIS